MTLQLLRTAQLAGRRAAATASFAPRTSTFGKLNMYNLTH